MMPGMHYEEKELGFDAGEGVLFYSDGLVEAHHPKGEMFGFPRLRALVARHGVEQSLGKLLLEKLYSFVGRAGSKRTTSPSLRYGALRQPGEIAGRILC